MAESNSVQWVGWGKILSVNGDNHAHASNHNDKDTDGDNSYGYCDGDGNCSLMILRPQLRSFVTINQCDKIYKVTILIYHSSDGDNGDDNCDGSNDDVECVMAILIVRTMMRRRMR